MQLSLIYGDNMYETVNYFILWYEHIKPSYDHLYFNNYKTDAWQSIILGMFYVWESIVIDVPPQNVD